MAASAQADLGGVGQAPVLERALAKTRWRTLPLLGICYLIAYMDRVNISFAAQTMNHDLGLSPKVYGLGSGLFFLSYALLEIPSNRLLLRFGARRWIARIMLTWGVLAGTMALVTGAKSFYTLRLLLGAAEAGYFPGAVFYISRWFPRSGRARAISLFYVSLPISSVVMGTVAGALLRLNGKLGLAGWQWMFMLEAAPAVLMAAVVWRWLPDAPASATWLAPEEREALASAVAREECDGESHAEVASDVFAVLLRWRTWKTGLMYFCQVAVLYAVMFSLPMLLSRLTGLSASRVGLLVAASGVAGAVVMATTAWVADRSGRQRVIVVMGLALMAICALLAGLALSGHAMNWLLPGWTGAIAGWAGAISLLAVLVLYYAIQGPVLKALSVLSAGNGAAIAIAAVNMCGLVGGFLGPYWIGWMHEATGGDAWGIGSLVVPLGVGAIAAARIVRDDKRAAEPVAALLNPETA